MLHPDRYRQLWEQTVSAGFPDSGTAAAMRLGRQRRDLTSSSTMLEAEIVRRAAQATWGEHPDICARRLREATRAMRGAA